MRIHSSSLFMGLLLLACKPGDQIASSRGQLDGAKTSEYSNNTDTAIDDTLTDTPASVSVPVSGINLTFRVSKDADPKSVDAYIVGYVDKLPVQRISDQEFVIRDVPAGLHEVIVTGLASSDHESNLGLRLPFESSGATLDLGLLNLPPTGGLQGQAEMEGVASFSTVQLQFPGTKIPAITTDAIGHYVGNKIPVGNHKLSWAIKGNPQSIPAAAKIESASNGQKTSRDIVRSKHNSPTNLKLQPIMNGMALSWISGGGNPVGYLAYRGLAQDNFQPVNGQSYAPGPQGAGTIVSVGAQQSVQDSGLTAGTNYTYRVFTYSRDLVYSSPRTGSGTALVMNSGYQRYRLYIESVANNCQSQGTAQIQALNFFINKKWQVNDFTSNTNVGHIGLFPATIAVNSMYNSSYDAFYAFQDDNLAWSSSFKTYDGNSPHNFLSNKNPDGIYFDIDFGGTRVAIEGLEMLGGEPPFYPECVPDSYYMMGSNDGTNWVAIPGSARQESTLTRVRYYFQNEIRPLSPLDFKLLSNEGQIQLSWESAAGAEVGYLLVRSRMPETFLAENGRSYTTGSNESGYEILHDGNQLTYMDTDFEDLQSPYYYTLFSYDANRQYAPAIVGRATPEKRQTYRYYRFHVMSILGGGPSTAWVDSLRLQINGAWVDTYNFTGMQGTIGSMNVSLVESSASGLNHANGLFGAGYWQTARSSFNAGGMWDAVSKTGEYVQMDFGTTPVAITGFRALGNTGYDANNKYVSNMYYQVPDVVRMERSQDGLQWEIIEGSTSGDSFALEIEQVW